MEIEEPCEEGRLFVFIPFASEQLTCVAREHVYVLLVQQRNK